jgi:hypothetical protein
VIGSHTARFVNEAPMRCDAQGQAEWRLCAIRRPEPRIEGQRLCGRSPRCAMHKLDAKNIRITSQF